MDACLHRDQEDGDDADEEEGGGVDEALDHVLPQRLDDEGHEGVHLWFVSWSVLLSLLGLVGWGLGRQRRWHAMAWVP